jgi:hypothetical protein
MVDEDNTAVFFLKTNRLINLISEKHLKMLVDDPLLNVKYPDEDDVKVKVDADDKVKRVRSQNLLNAINFN